MERITFQLILLLLTISRFAFASEEPNALLKILRVAGLNDRHLGIQVENENEVLFSLNPDRPLIPASLTKIVTGAAALELLTPQFHFHTQLLTDGTRRSALLDGSLYLKGAGDPSFTAEKLPLLVAQLSASSIRRINGNIFIDNYRFEDPNFSSISKARQRIGSWNPKGYPLFVILEPAVLYSPMLEGKVRSIITPRKNRDFVVYWNMNQPDLWTGHKFLYLLRKAGIEVSGRVERGRTPQNATRVAQVSSPLTGIVAQMMKASSNYYAEMLVRNLAAEKSQNPVTTQQGVQRIEEFLDHVGIARSEYEIRSGAGFSKQNSMSSANLLKVLKHMKEEKSIFPLFKNSFAVAGRDGTLKDRMKQPPAMGKILAKTGHLKGVVGLAGYAHTDGSLLSFVFLYNGPRPARIVERAFDRLCAALMDAGNVKMSKKVTRLD